MATGGIRVSNPYSYTDIGTLNPRGDLYDPATKTYQRTGAQKGTNAGEALNALLKTTGLPLLGSSSSSGSGGGSSASGAGSVPLVQMPGGTAGSDAAFARGKEKAGLNARASLTALSEALGSRNMLGGGAEAVGIGEVVGRAGQGVNEIIREQSVSDANNANSRAAAEYQGLITQRGQDLNVAQDNARRQSQALQGLLSVINSDGLIY
jgi:hypothetical protein